MKVFKALETIAIPSDVDIVSLLFSGHPIFDKQSFFNSSGNANTDLARKMRNSAPAFIDPITKTSLSFAKLYENVVKLAAGLITHYNFKKWDVAAIYAPNDLDYPVTAFGVLLAGGSVTTCNPTYTVDELIYQLEDSKARFVFTTKDFLPVAMKAAEHVGIAQSHVLIFGSVPVHGVNPITSIFVNQKNFVQNRPKFTREELHNKPAYLCYSSGTTGRPKGVITTHFNMVANILQCTACEKDIHGPGECWIAVLPFFHIYGLNLLMHTSVYNRIPVVVHPRFQFQNFLSSIQTYKITRIHVAPPIVLALAKSPLVENYDLRSLKMITCAAAPLTRELTELVKERLTSGIKQGYGMTEMSPISHMEPDNEVVVGSVGQLVPNAEALIVDPGTQKRLGPNEEGELWIRGPMVMKGYLNNEAATRSTLDEDGWLHTGDIAKVDERGHFFIVDRLKELIKVKGFQVAPAELEGLLLDHPAIADVAVVGVPDEAAGEVPRAFIVIKPEIEHEGLEHSIHEYVNTKVAPYKQLRGGIAFVNEIPKSASGKILRRMLRQTAAAAVNVKAKL